MNKSDFYYDLPENLIAQTPLEDRTSSRMLMLNKNTGDIKHETFKNIGNYLKKGDLLVINNTKVIPARLYGNKKGTGAAIEFLLLKRLPDDKWEVILRPGRKAKPGTVFVFGNGELEAEILETLEGGNRLVKFSYDGIFENVLDKLGETPLPPYIHEKLEDKNRYQTVYAKYDGSAAAPTAGLHFTSELMDELRQKGINFANVTLHVGLGTFRPVKCDNIDEHVMHSEWYNIDEENAELINKTRREGGRVIAVGTTSTRTLETVTDENGITHAGNGNTSIFIYPGYKFKAIDALITNFHLPESTLVMLVSALAGRENVLNAYNVAVDEKYRFFSFGDAMFIQ